MGIQAESAEVTSNSDGKVCPSQAALMKMKGSNISAGSESPSKSLHIYSVEDIKKLIAQGHAIVIYGKYVLKLDKWIERHPGGDKAIFHMIGRDAFDEMNSYHSPETIKHFKAFRIGILDHRWINLLPPIQGGVYKGSDKTFKARSKEGKLMSGEMCVRIRPKIPQGVIPHEGETDLYKIVEPDSANPIRDPEVVVDNFDNRMVKRDLESLPPLDYETQWFI